MRNQKTPSPCLRCTRVKDPRQCENKQCKPWRQWFLGRWELIHNYPRAQMEKDDLQTEGVNVGGRKYAAPHRVRSYLAKDPCRDCLCPKDLCTTPCRLKRAWLEAKGEEFL